MPRERRKNEEQIYGNHGERAKRDLREEIHEMILARNYQERENRMRERERERCARMGETGEEKGREKSEEKGVHFWKNAERGGEKIGGRGKRE